MSPNAAWKLARISKPNKGGKRAGAIHLYDGRKLLCKTRHKEDYLRAVNPTRKTGATCRTCIAMAQLQGIKIPKPE